MILAGFGSPLLRSALSAETAEHNARPLERARVLTALAVLLGINALSCWLALFGFRTWLSAQPDMTIEAVVNVGFGAGVFAFALAFATAFRRHWAPWSAPLYAVASAVFMVGLALGFEERFPGIALQGVLVTIAIVTTCAALYGSRIVRPTEQFRFAVFAATAAVALVYLASFALSLAGLRIPMIHSAGTGGILWSGFIVVLASMNLLIDFQRIDRLEGRPAPPGAPWFAALGVMVTMVWLYVSVLRLLARIRR